MIDLTPLEVRQKKGDFRRAMRGYDPELVDDFLDLVADRMEELVKEGMKLRDRVASIERELESFKQKESALSQALLAAQDLREETRTHAEKEGELLVREARLAAESAREEAARQVAREEETLRQVRARRAHLVSSFRRLLEREMAELSVIEETLGLDPAEAERSSTRLPAGRTAASASASAEAEPPAAEQPAAEPPGGGRESEPVDPERPFRRPGAGAPGEGGSGGAGRHEDQDDDWLSSLVEED